MPGGTNESRTKNGGRTEKQPECKNVSWQSRKATEYHVNADLAVRTRYENMMDALGRAKGSAVA